MEESLEYCDVCDANVDEISDYCDTCGQNVCYDCEGWCCEDPSY